jgi:hypothetical protein
MKQVHGGEAQRRTVVRPDVSSRTPIVLHACLTRVVRSARSEPSKIVNRNHIARSFCGGFIVGHDHAPQCDSSYHQRTHTLISVRGSEARSRQVTSAVREYAQSLRYVQTQTKTRLPGADTRGVQRSVVLHSPIIAAAPTTPVASSPYPRAKSPSLIEDGHVGIGSGRKDEFANVEQLGSGASLVVSCGHGSPISSSSTAERLRKSLDQVLDEDESSLLSGTMSGMGISRAGQTTNVSVGSTTVIRHHRTEGAHTHTSTPTPFGSSSFPHALAGTSATVPDEDGKIWEQATSVLGSGSGITTEERLGSTHAHGVRKDDAAMLAVVGLLWVLPILPPPTGSHSSPVWPPGAPPTKFLSVGTSPVIYIPDHPPRQERDLYQENIGFIPLASESSPPMGGPHSSRVLSPGPRTPSAKVLSVGIFTSPVIYIPDHPPRQERDLYQEHIGFIPLASVSPPPMGPHSSRVLPPGPRGTPPTKVLSVGTFTSPVIYIPDHPIPDHPPRQERDLCQEYIGFIPLAAVSVAAVSSRPMGPHSSRVLPPGPRTPPTKVLSVRISTSPGSYVPDHPPCQERDLYQENKGFIPLAAVPSRPMGPHSSRVWPPRPCTPPTTFLSVGTSTSPVIYLPYHPSRQERDLYQEYIGFSVFPENDEATALIFHETLQGFFAYGRHLAKDPLVTPRAMDVNSDMHNQQAFFADFGNIRMDAPGLVPASGPNVGAQSRTMALDDGSNQFITAVLVVSLHEPTLVFAWSVLRYFCSHCRESGDPHSTHSSCQTRSCHPTGSAAAPSPTATAWDKAKVASVNASLKLSTNTLSRGDVDAAYEPASPKPIASGPRTMAQLLNLQTLVPLPPTLVLPLLHRTLAVTGAGVVPK